MTKWFDLFYLNAMSKLALSVQSVLEDGESAMESGGAFAEQSSKIDQVGGGAYHLVFKTVIFILLCMFVIAGAKLALANQATRQDAKAHLFWIGLGTVVVCSAAAILVFFSDFGNGIFADMG